MVGAESKKLRKKIEIIAPRKIIICIFVAENENKNANQSNFTAERGSISYCCIGGIVIY